MKIVFNEDKTLVLFLHETPHEHKVLTGMPGFLKYQLFHSCPTILPVAYSLIQRCKSSCKDIKIGRDVEAWSNSAFKLRPLPESFRYHTSPKDFQDIALRFLYTLGSAGILLDPGMGKSKVVLDYIVLQAFGKSIIVCPKPLLFVWEDEIAIHRPELTSYTVETTDWEQEKAGIMAAQVTIINYTKACMFKHRLKEVGYDFIHLDEFLIKDPSTTRTTALTELSCYIPYRCGGSGTLVNNSPLDVFAPVRYLQPALVGRSYTNFLDKYTVKKKNNETGRSVIVNYRGADEVRSILESCCIVMTKEQWLKLPPKHFHDIQVQMGPTQKEAYYQLLQNYNLQMNGNALIVDNPLVMLSKLNQISNGFVYFNVEQPDEVVRDLLPDGTEPKKKTKRVIEFFHDCGKIEALRELLTEKIQGKRAIIWFNLEAEYQMIQALLEKLGHTYLTIKGGEKKIGDKVRTFNKSPDISWLVCQAKSVNYGVTVMGSKKKDLEDEGIEVLPGMDPGVYTEVFYSLSFSSEVYLQQQDRIHRLNQTNDCHYYRIFSNSPVEKKIRQAIEEKMCLRKEMLVDVAKEVLSMTTDEEITIQ